MVRLPRLLRLFFARNPTYPNQPRKRGIVGTVAKALVAAAGVAYLIGIIPAEGGFGDLSTERSRVRAARQSF